MASKTLTPTSKVQVLIPACDGTTSIATCEVFVCYEQDFLDLDYDVPTQRKLLKIYRCDDETTLAEICDCLAKDNLDLLCVSQSQIVSFVKQYPGLLCTGGNPNYFLIKNDDQVCTATVYKGESTGELSVHLNHLNSCMFDKDSQLIVPRLSD